MARGTSPVIQLDFDKDKLDFPFEGDLLEIQTESGSWIQSTRITFRSWDGPRRTTKHNTKLTINPRSIKIGSASSITRDYEGPVYLYGTNTQKALNNTFKILYSQKLELDKVNNRYY